MTGQLSVVVIDDDVQKTQALLMTNADCAYSVIDVDELGEEEYQLELEEADVILVDHELKPLASAPPPEARNGVALIPVLAQWLRHRGGDSHIPLIALYTSDTSLVPAEPQASGAHVLARGHGMDWAFAKANSESLPRMLPILAQGARTIADAFATDTAQDDSSDSVSDQLITVFNIPDAQWAPAARREVLAAQPPVFGAAEGVAPELVRLWLLHRIMPYPTFLIDINRAAARFGLGRDDFERLRDTALSDRLAAVAYSGALADFDGPRYWRAGIDHLVRDIGGGFDSARLQTELSALYGADLTFVEHPSPVVVLGEDLRAEPMPVPPGETVRVHVDQWPSYAEGPRVRRALATSTDLRHRVVEADLELLSTDT